MIKPFLVVMKTISYRHAWIVAVSLFLSREKLFNCHFGRLRGRAANLAVGFLGPLPFWHTLF
jgi:hypothetical protein